MKRRIVTIAGLFVLIAAFLAAPVRAETPVTLDGFDSVVSEGTLILTKYTGKDTSVTVPAAVEAGGRTYPVMIHSQGVFVQNKTVTDVTISPSVTFYNDTMRGLFYNCSALKTANMTGVDTSYINNMELAFYNCAKLETVKGYEAWNTGKVESIHAMFSGTSKLKTVDLSRWNLQSLKNSGWCFQNSGATQILLPDSIPVISAGFFNHANYVTGSSFTVGSGVKQIGYAHTFYDYGTSAFAEFRVAQGNTAFKAVDGILYTADGKKLLAIPRAKTFTDGVFAIPEGVTFLGELSFSRNTNIKNLILPDTLEIYNVPVNDEAYILYNDQGNLNAGNNVNIATYKFTGITAYSVKDTNPNYSSVEGLVYSKDGKTLVAVPNKYNKKISLPEGTKIWQTEAMWSASEGDSLLASCPGVEIPKSLLYVAPDQMAKLNRLVGDSFTISVSESNPIYKVNEAGKLVQRDAVDIEGGEIKILEEDIVYNGESKTPAVSVEVNGVALLPEQYTVSYENNVNAGEALVTVAGQGSFTGTVSTTFTIEKAQPVVETPEMRYCLQNQQLQDILLPEGFSWVTPKASVGEGIGRRGFLAVCKSSNPNYADVTVEITVQVNRAITIVAVPENATAANNKVVKTVVKASGTGLKYQWYFKSAKGKKFSKSSVKSATYSCRMSDSTAGRQVYCVITDKYGNSVKTNVVTLSNLVLTAQPSDANAKNGKVVRASVKASGMGLKYQWYIKSATGKKFSKSSVKSATYSCRMSASNAGRQVYCVITDKFGNSVTTDVVTLSNLVITAQPKTTTVAKGKTAKATVKATGTGLTYQWYVRDPGETSYVKSSIKKATYSFKMTKAKAGRRVYCVITDKYGNTVKSSTVILKMK